MLFFMLQTYLCTVKIYINTTAVIELGHVAAAQQTLERLVAERMVHLLASPYLPPHNKNNPVRTTQLQLLQQYSYQINSTYHFHARLEDREPEFAGDLAAPSHQRYVAAPNRCQDSPGSVPGDEQGSYIYDSSYRIHLVGCDKQMASRYQGGHLKYK